VFEHVTTLAGERWPGLFTNYCGSNVRRLAIAYGLDLVKTRPHDLSLKHVAAMGSPSPPERIESSEAPVKQIVWTGEDARLDRLPFFRNCERDSLPGWLTPVWMVRDLDGRYNISFHRGQYVDQQRMTIRFYPGRDVYDIFHAHKREGKKLRVA
jgi:UbiD family decarboxylase